MLDSDHSDHAPCYKLNSFLSNICVFYRILMQVYVHVVTKTVQFVAFNSLEYHSALIQNNDDSRDFI